ncbi:universal stress protein [Streptomyces millisiae]|uniref:Universal stress protein n=1 Tax=Streptomyces millisiae TaxID=3075542 RepID=A0ABU2LM46_9ACTN|nr:universal stress protein [Streptomyces sp. DSM 44918]MDT0318653.1 universal stress protein [Streptomyces sp. DSM 44918]
MEQPTVVGVDGSEHSLTAVDWAVDAAARHGGPLRLVYASFWERYEVAPSAGLDRPESATPARDVLAAAERRAADRQPDVKVSVDIVPEPPARALIEEGRHARAVVLGSRGRGPLTSMLLGSVSLGVAGRADCPVVVVRGTPPAVTGGFGRVVLGVKEPTRDAEALEFAFREAAARSCELFALHAWRPATDEARVADEAAARDLLNDALARGAERHPGVRVSRDIAEGPARPALLNAAEAADLLVIGAHRRRGEDGLRLGLTGHALLHFAACPVAVIPRP